MKQFVGFLYFLFNVATAMVGYNVNVVAHSACPLFWSVIDFLFSGIAIVKWLICHQLTHGVLVETFGFLYQ